MSFQKRLFSKIFFSICLCAVLSSLSVAAYAASAETLSRVCFACGGSRQVFVFERYEDYPTCVDEGKARYLCSNCEAILRVSVPALGHDFQETSRVDPTCGTSGISYQKCSRCTETRSETIPALEGDHVWKETSRREPTVETEGSITYTCSACGTTKTESIPKLEGCVHDWKETSRRDPTETSFGLVEYTCSICGASRSEVLPALSSGESMMGFEYVIFLFGKVWEMMLNNSLLTIFLVASLVGVGVRLFQRLKSAARL